jgi:hypothetical protein
MSYLEVIALYKGQILIAGDFNIHTDNASYSAAIRLNDILDSFDCTQHVYSRLLRTYSLEIQNRLSCLGSLESDDVETSW